MQEIVTVELDLAKNVFQVHAISAEGKSAGSCGVRKF